MNQVITTDINRCCELLKERQLVAVPTETVYGLAANALDEEAVEKIFEMKGRPKFNPLIIHIHELEQLEELATDIPKNALKLAAAFWPGSLTLILPKQKTVPEIITAGKATVGIRMPNHPLTLQLLKQLPFPIAAPSANPFTRISPTTAQHVKSYFGDRIPAILDGGPCAVGLESTIVGFNGEQPIIYRKGGISIDAIRNVVGDVKLFLKNETTPQAPGMLLKHYAPRTTFILTDDIEASLAEVQHKKIGILSYYKTNYTGAVLVKTLSPKKDLNEAGKNLFDALHQLDAADLDIIIAERMPDEGMGVSINDRLERAQKQ